MIRIETDETETLTAAELIQEAKKRAAWDRIQAAVAEIGPCPFCGIVGDHSKDGRTIEVGCRNQDCPVQPTVVMELATATTEEAVAAWNART